MIQNGEAQETTLANYTEGRKSVRHAERKTLNSLQSDTLDEAGACFKMIENSFISQYYLC